MGWLTVTRSPSTAMSPITDPPNGRAHFLVADAADDRASLDRLAGADRRIRSEDTGRGAHHQTLGGEQMLTLVSQ